MLFRCFQSTVAETVIMLQEVTILCLCQDTCALNLIHTKLLLECVLIFLKEKDAERFQKMDYVGRV